jgi:hypothetical protein
MARNISRVHIILCRHQKRSQSALIPQKTQVAYSTLQVHLKPVFPAPDAILHLYVCHTFIERPDIAPLCFSKESWSLRFGRRWWRRRRARVVVLDFRCRRYSRIRRWDTHISTFRRRYRASRRDIRL